jgi:hypothetical protein
MQPPPRPNTTSETVDLEQPNTSTTQNGQQSETPALNSSNSEVIVVDPNDANPGSSNARNQVRTPEPRLTDGQGQIQAQNARHGPVIASPNTPGQLEPFDWDDFQARYTDALAEASREEQRLVDEYDKLSRVSKLHRDYCLSRPDPEKYSISMSGQALHLSMTMSALRRGMRSWLVP